MKKKKELKNVDLRVRITRSEHDKLQKGYEESIYTDFAEYVRVVLRKEPVVKKCRNQSLDEILEVLVDLKNELGGIGRSLVPADAEYLISVLNKIYERCAQEGSGSQ